MFSTSRRRSFPLHRRRSQSKNLVLRELSNFGLLLLLHGDDAASLIKLYLFFRRFVVGLCASRVVRLAPLLVSVVSHRLPHVFSKHHHFGTSFDRLIIFFVIFLAQILRVRGQVKFEHERFFGLLLLFLPV